MLRFFSVVFRYYQVCSGIFQVCSAISAKSRVLMKPESHAENLSHRKYIAEEDLFKKNKKRDVFKIK